MPYNRLWVAGGELNSRTLEFTSYGTWWAVTSEKARTGNYCYRTRSTSRAYWNFTNMSQVSVGCWVNHNGVEQGTPPIMQVVSVSGATDIPLFEVRLAGTDLEVWAGQIGVVINQVSAPAFAAVDTWHHVGLDARLAPDGTGYSHLSLDGQIVSSYIGPTRGSTVYYIRRISFGPVSAAHTWNPSIYYDDLFATGDSFYPDPVPPSRFAYLRPTAPGATSQFTGSDGDSVDNHLLVAEAPPDDDATYIESDTVGHRDGYRCAPSAEIDGRILGVTPVACARRTVTATSRLRPYMTLDGQTLVPGTPWTPTLSYAIYQWSQGAAPDGGDWTIGKLQDAEFGIEVVA